MFLPKKVNEWVQHMAKMKTVIVILHKNLSVTLYYYVFLDSTWFKDGSQKSIDNIEKWPSTWFKDRSQKWCGYVEK